MVPTVHIDARNIGGHPSGLNRFDPRTERFTAYQSERRPGETVGCILEDKSEIFGSARTRAFKFDPGSGCSRTILLPTVCRAMI
jgi:hypothetical protein